MDCILESARLDFQSFVFNDLSGRKCANLSWCGKNTTDVSFLVWLSSDSNPPLFLSKPTSQAPWAPRIVQESLYD
jgi:hypothetical protein